MQTQDITLQLDAFGQATLTTAMIDNGSMDNCGISSMTVDPSCLTVDQIGSQRYLNRSDGTNTSEAQAIVTIEDNIAPELTTCPSNITSLACDGLDHL